MSEKLSPRVKLLYGVGDTGLSLTGTIIGAFFAIFLTDVAGISARPGRRGDLCRAQLGLCQRPPDRLPL